MKRKLKNKWGVTLFLGITSLLGACSGDGCESEGRSQAVMHILTSGI